MTFQYFFFDTYLGYFLQALPISLLVSIVYGIIKYRNDTRTVFSQKVFSCLFVFYITGIVLLVLCLNLIGSIWYFVIYHMPSGNSIPFFNGGYNFIPDFWNHINKEVIGNFFAFMPFGVLYPLSHKKATWKRTIFVGFLFVLSIELLQPIVGRSFDTNDIILNTSGIIISSAVLMLIIKRFKK